MRGICSLAEGSDQIFAECVVAAGGQIVAVIPSEGYDQTFGNEAAETFRRLLSASSEVIRLGHGEPSEAAFWAAGKYVVDESDRMIAVWDGRPAAGLGGTADVVAYAEKRGKEVTVIWPSGATRKVSS